MFYFIAVYDNKIKSVIPNENLRIFWYYEE